MALWRKELLLAHTLSPPIQITQAFATPIAGRVGPRAKFKVPWMGPGLFGLFDNGGCGHLKALVGEYD